ncbi:DUF3606 domain-containing protein [Pseudomonas sp. JUb52]|uniref:DUF3606 domain-containing protein n=1 Tax=Pseudomonas sp. JUb52 TaxID=2485127 RepID=UPI00104D20AB|nr:DUF3606 domain-containing protein [Pseudomonas sp. JUb52]TCQ85841.1 uncharacterized protein DUF3606 [Pseudomonas sp. JUb52]
MEHNNDNTHQSVDRSSVNLDSPEAMTYWLAFFGCDRDDLIQAWKLVGSGSVAGIRGTIAYLEGLKAPPIKARSVPKKPKRNYDDPSPS